MQTNSIRPFSEARESGIGTAEVILTDRDSVPIVPVSPPKIGRCMHIDLFYVFSGKGRFLCSFDFYYFRYSRIYLFPFS